MQVGQIRSRKNMQRVKCGNEMFRTVESGGDGRISGYPTLEGVVNDTEALSVFSGLFLRIFLFYRTITLAKSNYLCFKF